MKDNIYIYIYTTIIFLISLIFGCIFCFIFCRKHTTNEQILGKQNSLTQGSISNILYTDATGNISASQLESNKLVKSNSSGQLQSYTEAGMISYFAMEKPPTGWLLCDGTSYSTDVYPDLFAAIGITYGGKLTNFNVPDLRGYFLRGYDPTGSVDVDRSGTGFGTIQLDKIRNHTHSFAGWTGGGGMGQGPQINGNTNIIFSAGGVDGGLGGTETRPKNIAMLACIKT